MNKQTGDLLSVLEKEFLTLKGPQLEECGTVVRVFDGIVEIYGLDKVEYFEVLNFESGNKGLVLKLEEKIVIAVLLNKSINVLEKEAVTRTGFSLKVGASDQMLGRVLNSIGMPIDDLGDINIEKKMDLNRMAYGIIDRAPVNRPFETGFLAIDALIPIGKGQRELLVGDRATGKTAVIIDTILNQKDKNVICIYVAIGNKRSSTARMIDTLQKNDAMKYTIVVEADANSAAVLQYLAPYSACAIAEFFMDKGKDVFIAYDNLSNHAVAYRSLSLLLRRPPGREAFPGDIFYIHSRLLERACQLSQENGGGSMTAMPVVETLGNDIAAYVPTNLISITDGQIIFDSNLFNLGVKPAIKLGVSVSRIGSVAQRKAMKKVQGVLKLDLAQYEELVAFSKFGSDLDKTTKFYIDRGNIAIQLLKQGRRETYSFSKQVLILILLNNGCFDIFSPEVSKQFASEVIDFINANYAPLVQEIEQTGDVSDETIKKVCSIAKEFFLYFRQN